MANLSAQDWQGVEPNKWHLSQKVHIRPKDQIGSVIEGIDLNMKERKHFDEKLSNLYNYKPGIRQFDGLHSKQTYEVPLNQGMKQLHFKPDSRKDRPENRHFQEFQSGHVEDVPFGIKTFSENNQSKGDQWNVDDKMGHKKTIRSLQQQRNGLNVLSMGDKQYRHPDYSSDFFKEGGLVPGQNIQIKIKQKKKGSEITLLEVKSKHIPVAEQQRLDERKLDKEAIDELEGWVENVLKEANPNYKDPDLFFEREEQLKPGDKVLQAKNQQQQQQQQQAKKNPPKK